jgi:hypothetical protein
MQSDEYLNRPKAGQPLSEPWTQGKSVSTNNYSASNFKDVLKSIQDEQAIYKQVSDPNFKLFSEDEIQAEAQKKFNNVWGNKTWQDVYIPKDQAKRAKARQDLVEEVKQGRADPVALGFFDKYQNEAQDKADAMDLFTRLKSAALPNFENELRQLAGAKKYFDSAEGKKRAEAGKKLLDFYGTQTGLADETVYQYGQNDPYRTDLAFTFVNLPRGGEILGGVKPTTEYQKRYASEVEKLKSKKQESLSESDYKNIRDTIMQDFNKSVGFTGKFTPYEFTNANLDTTVESFKRNPNINKNFSSEQELRQEALNQLGQFKNGAPFSLNSFLGGYGPTQTARIKDFYNLTAKNQPYYSWLL